MAWNPIFTFSATWGNITGTLADQTDLQAALASKAGTGANTFSDTQTIRGAGNSSRRLVFANNQDVAVAEILGNGGGGMSIGGNGSFVRLRPNGVDSASGQLYVAATGEVTASGPIADNNGDVRKLKGRFSVASTTITTSDLNGVIEKRSSGGNHDCLLPSDVGSVRDAITFVNSTTGTLTVVRGTSTAIYSNGTDGDLVIGPFSMRTIYKANAAGRWIA